MTTSMVEGSGCFDYGGILAHPYVGGACLRYDVLYYYVCMDYWEGKEALRLLMWMFCMSVYEVWMEIHY